MLMTCEDRELIARTLRNLKRDKKLPDKAKSDIGNLQSELALKRFELENLRPKVPSFQRPFQCQVEIMEPIPGEEEVMRPTGKWEWVTKMMMVSLRQFNPYYGAEGKALEIGEKIFEIKNEILAIIQDNQKTNRKQVIARM